MSMSMSMSMSGTRDAAVCDQRTRNTNRNKTRRQIVRDPSTSLPPSPELRRGKQDDKRDHDQVMRRSSWSCCKWGWVGRTRMLKPYAPDSLAGTEPRYK